MPSAPPALIRDFLAWLAVEPRAYAEAMEVWRTSCPRLTIWEDAVDEQLIVRRAGTGAGGPVVELTAKGRAWLERSGAGEDRHPGRLVRHA
jgi:hypothetical protein